MTIYIVTNMYPTVERPSLGAFVKNIHLILERDFDVEVIKLNSTTGFFSKLFQYLNFYIKTFKSALFSKQSDVFYLHYPSHTFLPFILISRLKNFKIITHVHGGDVKLMYGANKFFFKIKRFIVRKAFSSSLTILVPSTTYLKFLVDEYSLQPAKVRVSPSGGIDRKNFFRFRDFSERKYDFAYVGRLESNKNLPNIISFFNRLIIENQDLKILIVGNGTLFPLVAALHLKFKDSCVILEAVSQNQLIDVYNDIKVLVYPSYSESLGLVPLEALCCGCNVILSPLDVFTDMLGSFSPFIAKGFDSDSLYSTSSELLKLNVTEVEDEKSKVVDTILKRLDSERVSQDLTNFFMSLIYENK